MVTHAIVANDEHPSWPITLGYEGVTGVPTGAAWPAGTTVVMVSKKTGTTSTSKVLPAVIESLATHEVLWTPAVGNFVNADEGEHDVQWEVKYPDGTTETWPKAGTFDKLTVGKDLGGAA